MKALIPFLTFLLVFSFSPFHLSAQQGTGKTSKYPCINMGESFATIREYKEGYLTTSTQFGHQYLPNFLRRLDGNDEVMWNVEFDSTYSFYFHPVVTTDDRLFVFGAPAPGWNALYDIHFCIMDSAANVLLEKKLTFPFDLNLCHFFPAADGGVIGIVNEVCNYSRIMRIDRDGNVMWFKSYIPVLAPSSGTGRSRIRDIYHIGNGRYMVCGYQGFGYGTMYFRIDDNGNLIDDAFHDLTPGFDVMWESDFDGGKTVALYQEDFDLDSTFMMVVDTALNVLDARYIDLPDSIFTCRDVMFTKDDIIIMMALGQYSPYPDPKVAVVSVPQQGNSVNWMVETYIDGAGTLDYYNTSGIVRNGNDIVIAGVYDAKNLSNNGGNNYDYFHLTHLDPADGEGFCDANFEQTFTTPISHTSLGYYMDTLPQTNFTESLVQQVYTHHTPVQPELVCEPDSISAVPLEPAGGGRAEIIPQSGFESHHGGSACSGELPGKSLGLDGADPDATVSSE